MKASTPFPMSFASAPDPKNSLPSSSSEPNPKQLASTPTSNPLPTPLNLPPTKKRTPQNLQFHLPLPPSTSSPLSKPQFRQPTVMFSHVPNPLGYTPCFAWRHTSLRLLYYYLYIEKYFPEVIKKKTVAHVYVSQLFVFERVRMFYFMQKELAT